MSLLRLGLRTPLPQLLHQHYLSLPAAPQSLEHLAELRFDVAIVKIADGCWRTSLKVTLRFPLRGVPYLVVVIPVELPL